MSSAFRDTQLPSYIERLLVPAFRSHHAQEERRRSWFWVFVWSAFRRSDSCGRLFRLEIGFDTKKWAVNNRVKYNEVHLNTTGMTLSSFHLPSAFFFHVPFSLVLQKEFNQIIDCNRPLKSYRIVCFSSEFVYCLSQAGSITHQSGSTTVCCF